MLKKQNRSDKTFTSQTLTHKLHLKRIETEELDGFELEYLPK